MVEPKVLPFLSLRLKKFPNGSSFQHLLWTYKRNPLNLINEVIWEVLDANARQIIAVFHWSFTMMTEKWCNCLTIVCYCEKSKYQIELDLSTLSEEKIRPSEHLVHQWKRKDLWYLHISIFPTTNIYIRFLPFYLSDFVKNYHQDSGMFGGHTVYE